MAHTLTTSAKGLRALVLDADPASLRSLAWSLEARFFSVCSAPDGTGGLDRLLEELLSLDVVVIDEELPGRDALSFADLIRRAGGERDLALVVVAASPAPALRAACRARGIDAVVDRRDGPDAAALAAIAAVASRAARSLEGEAAAAPEPEPEPESPRGFAPFIRGWSLLTA